MYSAFTRDLAESCNKTILVTATLNSYIPPDGQDQPQCSNSFDFEAKNPCLTTTISIAPTGIENFAVFAG